MPDETFEEVKTNLYRFTIKKEPDWDDPSHGYQLEMIVAYLERDEDGQVCIWYSHHESYRRKKKNLRWKLEDGARAKMTT